MNNRTLLEMTLPVVVKYKYNENSEGNVLTNEKKTGSYVCNICGNKFYRKANLTIHVNSHNFDDSYSEDGKREREMQNTCNLCFKKFTAKKNLLKHLREVHKNFSEAQRMVVKKIKCPKQNCEFVCRMMKDLREHIEKCHKIKILKDVLEFSNEAVFLKWKKEEETNTVSWFVTGRKKTTLMDGTKKQILYCHRTGHYHPKGYGKYRMRSVGSCKIGVTCPAAMEVIESPDGGITVIYYKTHLGHMQDVVYLKLSSEERANLAEKIKQGFSFDAILDDVKESRDVNSDRKKRIHLLSKKDLYSIMRTANCSNKKIPKKGNEIETGCESIEKWVNKTKENNSAEECITVKGTEGNVQHFNDHHTHNLISNVRQDGSEKNQIPKSIQKHQGQNILEISKEGTTSQIVIVTPDIDYSSIAEIFLLSQNSATQPAILAQTKLGESHFICKTKPPSCQDLLEEKNKINKSSVHLQLKEKLQRISKLLPQSEYLTPRQFQSINVKLDGVLDIFHVANSKAKSRKQTTRKKTIKRNQILKSSSKTDEYKIQETVQMHENPFQLYAVFN